MIGALMLVVPPPRDPHDETFGRGRRSPLRGATSSLGSSLFTALTVLVAIAAAIEFNIFVGVGVFVAIPALRGMLRGLFGQNTRDEVRRRRTADPSRHPPGQARDARDRGDLNALLDMLSSTDSGERIWAAIYLGDLGDARAIDLLLRALRSTDQYVRMFAVGALGRIGDERTGDAIFELGRTDEAVAVRCASAEALMAIGDRRSIDLFESLLSERAPIWRRIRMRYVERQLVELSGIDALPALEAAARRGGPIQKLRLRKTIAALKRAP